MQPLQPDFDSMLSKYIPQLTKEQRRRHERLFALRHELLHEFPSQSQPNKIEAGANIVNATDTATSIILNSAPVYEAVHRLWVARRRFAVEQGNFFQVPPTWNNFTNYGAAALNYGSIWRATFSTRWNNVLSHYQSGVIASLVIALLVLIGCSLLLPVNRPPEVTIPQISVAVGDTVNVIVAVTDPDHPLGTLTYSLSPNSFLSVNAEGKLTGIPNNADLGTHNLVLEVRDPAGSITKTPITVAVVQN